MLGEYRLPRAVADRLDAALQGRKNAPACLALAHFLARFWSSPRRLLCAFPIDRRALAEHEGLGLTEARVRGALSVLVEIGFLARYEPDAGKRYQRTEGGLQRRAILHRFEEAYAVEFGKANARAQAKRGTPAPARRPASVPVGNAGPLNPPSRQAPRPPHVPGRNMGANGVLAGYTVRPIIVPGENNDPERRTAGLANVPVRSLGISVPDRNAFPQLAQKQAIGGSRVIMGEEKRAVPDNPLEAALARWARAIGG